MPRSLWIRIAVSLWVAVVLAVGIRVAIKPRSGTVVPIYLAAGERWSAGQSLYELVPSLDLYRYPPIVAAGFAALTPLPESVTGDLWRGLGVAVLLTGLARFRTAIAPTIPPGPLFVLAAILAIPGINNGQANIHLAGMLLHGIAAASRGKWWEAAAWLGGAVWLKPYVIASALLVGLVAPRTFGPKVLAILALGTGLPFLLHDPSYALGQCHEFLDSLGGDDRTHAGLYRTYRDWTVIPRGWFGLTVPANVRLAVALLAAAVAAGLTWTAGNPLRRGAVLGTVWLTAFGPATEANSYTLFAGLAAVSALTPNRPRWAQWFAWVGCGLLVATVVRGLFAADWQFQVFGPQPLGAIMIGVAELATLTVPTAPPVIWWSRIGRRKQARADWVGSLHEVG